ncbi:TPA: hypothetical protein HA318_04290 [Candidatus Micrarchaeota archaeon]|nr:hypothetical protein [Candidatus Micrarchaeota archaeon]
MKVLNAIITLILLIVALFFLQSGQVFFAFLFIAGLAVALMMESGGERAPTSPRLFNSGLDGTEKKAFGGEKEIGERFGYFINFIGNLFGAFWGSFGKEPEKKKDDTPTLVVQLKK